jgi:tetratricopeptide (TPR) repeat protein
LNRTRLMLKACGPLMLMAAVACGGAKAPVEPQVEAQPKVRVIKPREVVAEANQQIEAGEYQEAVEALDMLLEKQPDNVVARYNRGVAHQRLGNYAEAKSDYQAVLEAKPNDLQAALNLGAIYVELGREEKAIALYESKLEQDEFNPALLNNLSVLYRKQEQYDKAIQAVQKLLMRDKNNVDAYKNLALVYSDQGKLKLAQTILENARRMSKEQGRSDPDIYVNLGMLFLRKDDNGQAMAAFKEALEMDPDHLEANYNVGGLALSHRDYALAERSYAEVAEQLPNSPKVAMYLGHAAQGQQKFDEAMTHFERSLKLEEKRGGKADPKVYEYLIGCATQSQSVEKGLSYCSTYSQVSGVTCAEDDYDGICGQCNGLKLMKQMAEEAAAPPPEEEAPKATGREIFTEEEDVPAEEAPSGGEEAPAEGQRETPEESPQEGEGAEPADTGAVSS